MYIMPPFGNILANSGPRPPILKPLKITDTNAIIPKKIDLAKTKEVLKFSKKRLMTSSL